MERTGKGRLASKPYPRSRTKVGLQTQINRLRTKLRLLRKDVEFVRATLAEDVIVLRSISREEAKQEISELFLSGDTLFYSDIAARLQLDLPLVVEICHELQQEGEIEVDADYAV